MAEPSKFPEANAEWVGEGGIGSLPAFREGVENISRWELTEEELVEVASTGVVWLHVWGNHPAVCVAGESPFVAKVETPKFSSKECVSPVCSTMTCSNCGECPNRCGFDLDEPSPHYECTIAQAEGEAQNAN